MTTVTWDRLGPREKQVLAILRRAETPLTTREVLRALEDEGGNLAYTTVSTVLDRLAEKEVVDREKETHAGSPRYRYCFDDDEHRGDLVAGAVDDVAAVFGDRGLETLVRRAQETKDTTERPQ